MERHALSTIKKRHLQRLGLALALAGALTAMVGCNTQTDQELLASAHGLYRGGLGVHLVLCSLAAGLGLSRLLTPAAEFHRQPGRADI